jgi:hypothetical protein
MRVVDLHDVDADLPDQLDFTAQRRHAVAHEVFTTRVRGE